MTTLSTTLKCHLAKIPNECSYTATSGVRSAKKKKLIGQVPSGFWNVVVPKNLCGASFLKESIGIGLSNKYSAINAQDGRLDECCVLTARSIVVALPFGKRKGIIYTIFALGFKYGYTYFAFSSIELMITENF